MAKAKIKTVDDAIATVDEKLAHYDTILELGKVAEEKQRIYLADKEAAKESKDDWEAAVGELQRAIKRANDPQQNLPFADGE